MKLSTCSLPSHKWTACFNTHFGDVFRRISHKSHNVSILYPNEEASFVPSEASTIFTTFSSYTPHHIHHSLEISFLHTFFIFTLFPSMFYIFAVHPVCSTNGPLHNDSLLCQLPNWYVSCTIQLHLPSSSCCKGYIT